MNQRERTQQRMHIEGVLQIVLNNVIEKVKQDPRINDISQAQMRYTGEIEAALRKGATQAYDLGSDYVDDKFNFYGVTQDEITKEADIINRLTTEYEGRFWRKVSGLLHRNDILIQTRDYAPRSPLNSNYMASSTAIGIVTRAMALGTIEKTKILTKPRLKQASSFRPNPIGLSSGERDETKDQVLWNAINDRNTCDVCAELDGQYFDVDDPNMPIPADACLGRDNCRCDLSVELATSLIVREGLTSVEEQYL